MTVWSRYARCPECGVDAGLACRDEHDEVAVEVCDGRELVIADAADVLDRSRERPKVKLRPRNIKGCRSCGVPLPARRKWCDAEACHLVWRARKSAVDLKREQAKRKRERGQRPCFCCGATIVTDLRHGEHPHCGSDDCRAYTERVREAQRKAAYRARTIPPPEPYNCAWCYVLCTPKTRRQSLYCGKLCADTAARHRQSADPESFRCEMCGRKCPPRHYRWCGPICRERRRTQIRKEREARIREEIRSRQPVDPAS